MSKKIFFLLKHYHFFSKKSALSYFFRVGCRRNSLSMEINSRLFYPKIKNSKKFLIRKRDGKYVPDVFKKVFISLNDYPRSYKI